MLVFLGGLGVLGGCALVGGDDLPGSARGWIEGPVRWLVLPEEARRFRRLGSNAEVLAFIEEFWARRDPDPDTPGNPFVQEFFERVQEADLLYAGEGGRGSLSDRGRAYILLGSPGVLRYTQLSAPTWDPGGRPRSPTEQLRLEVWGYERENLPERLAARLEEQGVEFPVEVRFLEERRSTRLLEGEDLLEKAARAAVRREA